MCAAGFMPRHIVVVDGLGRLRCLLRLRRRGRRTRRRLCARWRVPGRTRHGTRVFRWRLRFRRASVGRRRAGRSGRIAGRFATGCIAITRRVPKVCGIVRATGRRVFSTTGGWRLRRVGWSWARMWSATARFGGAFAIFAGISRRPSERCPRTGAFAGCSGGRGFASFRGARSIRGVVRGRGRRSGPGSGRSRWRDCVRRSGRAGRLARWRCGSRTRPGSVKRA